MERMRMQKSAMTLLFAAAEAASVEAVASTLAEALSQYDFSSA